MRRLMDFCCGVAWSRARPTQVLERRVSNTLRVSYILSRWQTPLGCAKGLLSLGRFIHTAVVLDRYLGASGACSY